jgi:peroxiredoxin (alkyl hydroperoxide reductase subunit C)
MLGRIKKGRKSEAAVLRSPLEAGAIAPGFTLLASTDEAISLADYCGQPVVLVFYPADWSGVCGDQLALYNEVLPLFDSYNAQVLAISVDGLWCHKAFAANRNLQFPLLSDFHPKGEVARSYGAYDFDRGSAQRALFVIDGEGIIRWSHVSPPTVNPGADGILRALESIQA